MQNKRLRLKKLELLGFKSFADKTSLEFSEGVTGVVGPNGCGKSNISDAFRWVLGEQSAKSMRGNKMHDVIFAGTANRPPLNIAEVTITLSNEDGSLPVPYSEVSVTRRLHRNGESDYLLNRRSVRLKDLQDLFLDTGMGKNAFSIFEQGKIDQVIQNSPLERRYIFEEAAGILRFLQRKRETLRKLEQVDLNISRAKDINLEVEKQIVVLAEQADKARVYKQQRFQLDLLEKTLLVLQWETLQQRLEDATKREHNQKKHHLDAVQELEKLQIHLNESKQQLLSNEQALRIANEELFQTRSDKEIKVREGQSQQERLKESLTKEKRWQHELENLLEKRHLRQIEHATAQKKHAELEILISESGQVLNAQREKTRHLEESVTALRENQQLSQQERLKLLQAENHVESELKQNKIRQEALQEKREALQQRKGKLSKHVEELIVLVEERKIEKEAAVKTVDDQKSVFQSMIQHIQDLSAKAQTSKRNLDVLQKTITECEARQKVLIRLRDDMEGFSAGSKKLLQESSNPKSPFFNLLRGLYEFLSPNSGAEAALAGTLRPYTQTLVVETQEQLNQVIAFAKQQQLKDFSLLCLENLPSIPQSPEKKSLNAICLTDQVAPHPLVQHFLQNIFIVDSLEGAIKVLQTHQNAAVWISEGLLLDEKCVLFYGAQGGVQNVFLREAELKSLANQLKSLSVEKDTLNKELEKIHRQRDKAEAEKAALDKSIRRDEMKLVEVNFGYQRLSSDLEKAHVEEKQLGIDAQNVQVTLEKIVTTLSELTHQYVSTKAKGTQIQQKCDEFHTDLNKQMVALKQERELLHEKDSSYRKMSDDDKKLLHSLHILEIHDRESQQQERRLVEEIQLSKELQAQLTTKRSELEEGLRNVDQSLISRTSTCQSLDKEVSTNKQKIEQQIEKVQLAKSRIAKIEEEIRRIEHQKSQYASNIQGILTESQERYNALIEELNSLISAKPSGSIEQIERQIRSLRQEMERAGDVNMTSIEECDKHRERFDFLNQQLQDLEKSRQELIEIITELDTESRKIFTETFEAIRTNFKKHYKTLFNGGESDLQFSESKDILEAGIEIVARPPGKQMSSISLLSGGEKCLTAMALLFAIFEVKPAPFCILDEIDAPLDDSNVQRFASMVKQFIDRCQFIIITHNKHTMAIADVLCGVSMQEKGVSKLLTMEFAKRQEQEQQQEQPLIQMANA